MSDIRQCLTCKWWDRKDFNEPTNRYWRKCECFRSSGQSFVDGPEIEAPLFTSNDFGCVLHEERPQDERIDILPTIEEVSGCLTGQDGPCGERAD